MTKRKDTVRAARERLHGAIEAACSARGSAQWVNGYRAGRGKYDDSIDKQLFAKERRQFQADDAAEMQVKRAITAYARAVRAAQTGEGE